MAGKAKLKRGTRGNTAGKVTLPPVPWDLGPDTAAQRAGKEIEDAGEVNPATGKVENPNGVKRARRVDMLEVYHRRGWLTAGQLNAAEALRSAWEQANSGPVPALAERVDSTPNPTLAVAIQADNMSPFVRIWGKVPREDRGILSACVLANGTPGQIREYRNARHGAGMDALRAALSRLASAIGS